MARVPIKCPPLGVSVFTGVLAQWYVKVGDEVHKDQPIWIVETDKVSQDVLSPSNGTLAEILVAEGEVIEPEQVVGQLETSVGAEIAPAVPAPKATEAAAATPPKSPAAAPAPVVLKAPPPVAPLHNAPAQPAPQPVANGGTLVREKGGKHGFSPSIRRLAEANNLSVTELSGIPATGRHGQLKATDVESYLAGGRRAAATAAPTYAPSVAPTAPTRNGHNAPAQPAAPSARTPIPVRDGVREEKVETQRLTTIRKTIAGYLRHSVDTAVHCTSIDEADVTDLILLRKQLKDRIAESHGLKLTYTSFIARAVALSLVEYPLINSVLDLENEKVIVNHHVHLGIAVDAPAGLMVPVIRHADQMGLLELQAAIAEFGEKARTGQITVDELRGSTFSITNAGATGSIASTPIINYPNVGILGVHKFMRLPCVVDDQIVIRDMVNLAVTFDHRLVDGVYTVLFLQRVIEYLQNPGLLLVY